MFHNVGFEKILLILADIKKVILTLGGYNKPSETVLLLQAF